MGFASDAFTIFGGLFAVLFVASAIAWLLRMRVAKGQPHSVIDNLVARINAWWVMVVIIGLAVLFGKVGVVALFGLASLAALREFVSITYTRQSDHDALVVAFYIFLPLQYFLIWYEWYAFYSILIPVYAFLILAAVAVMRGDTTRFLERTAKVQWALMICVYCLSHVPALITLELIPGHQGRNMLLIVYLVLVVQASDVLQYVCGKLFGKTLIAPTLSPSKTVEGFVGGVAAATALGTAMWWITPFNLWQAALVSLAITLFGFAGGLVMSAIKRDHNVKDWGHMIEGHGGMLDRIDSVVFSAPIFFHIVRYWWTV